MSSRRKVADKIADMFIGFIKQDANPNRAGYVYKTVNTVDGMKYIGSKLAPKGHTGTYFNENYYGSGSDLKKAIDQYGIGNFINVKEIDTRTFNGLKKAEQGLLNKVDARQDPTYYNRHNHYSGGGDITDATRKKLSEVKKGNKHGLGYKHTEEAKKRIAKAQKGRTISREHKGIISKKTSQRPYTKEGKDIINKIIDGNYNSPARNKLNVKNVYAKPNGRFVGQVQINGKQNSKSFDTIEEAVAWRESMLNNYNKGLL